MLFGAFRAGSSRRIISAATRRDKVVRVRIAQWLEHSVDPSKMVPKRRFSLVSILALERIDNGRMLIDQLLDHIRHRKTQSPDAVQMSTRAVEQIGDARITTR